MAIYKQEDLKDSAKRYQKVIYFVILFIGLVWCAGILIAPLWAGYQDVRDIVSDLLYSFYSKSCHQEDSRSLHIGWHKLGVCSRCTSIYFSFLLATILYPFVRRLNNIDMPPMWILFTGAGLVAIDAGLDMFDVIKNTFITREITGAILGFILAFFILPGIIRLFYEFFQPPKVIPKK